MSNEITLRLKCNITELCDILERKGFSIIDKYYLEDIFYIDKNMDINTHTPREILTKYILIRNITQFKPNDFKKNYNEVILTFKEKNIAEDGTIISQKKENCKINDIEEGKAFLKAIGYRELMTIREKSIEYEKEVLQITVKDVENSDKMIELETSDENNELDTIEKLIKKLNELELPIDTSDYFVKKAEIELEKILLGEWERMSNINLNLYRVFCKVAETHSFSKAAELLDLSQGNVSTQIANLEEQLNLILFNREQRGVSLTEDGRELYEIVSNLVSKFDFAEKIAKNKNSIETANIKIGSPSHITTYFLMDRIEQVKKDFPELTITVICEVDPNKMMELLQNHEIDFAVTDARIDNNIAEIEELRVINNIFVSKTPLTISNIKEIEDLNCILNINTTKTTKRLEELLKKHGVTIKSSITSDATEVRVDAVKRNMGIAYVMKDAVKKDLARNELYEVEMPIVLPSMRVNLVYLKGEISKASKQFIKDYLKK